MGNSFNFFVIKMQQRYFNAFLGVLTKLLDKKKETNKQTKTIQRKKIIMRQRQRSKSFLFKSLFFLTTLVPHFLFAQDIAQHSTSTEMDFLRTETIEVAPVKKASQSLFLHVDYDQKNHLLTIATKDKLQNATITVLTGKDRVIYQESSLKIENHYLLSIDENSPKGVYYIYIEEADRGIWIEKFTK